MSNEQEKNRQEALEAVAKMFETGNQVEETADALISAMKEFAPIYGFPEKDILSRNYKDYTMHVVASLINDGFIQKRDI